MSPQDVVASLRLSLKSWLLTAPAAKGKTEVTVVIWGAKKDTLALKRVIGAGLAPWQWSELLASSKTVHTLATKRGAVLVVRPRLLGADEPTGGHGDLLALNDYSRGRETVGQALASVFEMNAKSVTIDFQQCSQDLLTGGLIGMELAAYQFRRVFKGAYPPKLSAKLLQDGRALNDQHLAAAVVQAQAVNLARHLTNLPPNALNPESYAAAIKQIFGKGRGCQVEVWGPAKLKAEKMNLLLAVGQAASAAPQMVRIRYRPTKAAKKVKPMAFVGKGITFDTGGVNLKPDAAMRLMKKDMGGSASVVGLAYWVSAVKCSLPCDFYLALAENSIGGRSFRPGDVITARSGTSVEIHNTDAEGRLVLADVMDVAVQGEPRMLIDVATLTGAIKAGLGSGIGGLFGNDDKQVHALAHAAQKAGDWLWPMPLHRKYKSALRSSTADMVNAGDGFGGAITAALFLEGFSGNVPWLHLDIYAWKDGADGAFSEAGGSGQAVQALCQWLATLEPK